MATNAKRFLCMLLAALMVLSTPVSVFAENSTSTVDVTESEVSITEALAEAKDGDTVTLSEDTETSIVVVPENVTLDLNGYKLKATYFVCYGTIVDQSESNAGVLEANAKRLYIREDNEQLPVKTGEGYKFFEVTKFNSAYLETSSKYVFQPFVEEVAHALIMEGAETSGVTVNVRISWIADGGKRSQDFAFSDALVQKLFGSYNAATGKYGQQLSLTLKGAEDVKNLSFSAVVSGANVSKYSEATVINKTEENLPTDNNQLAEEMTIDNGMASAVVPMGTELEEGAKELTLTTEEMDATTSNIQLNDGEQMLSMDVHVNGVSKDNTVPVIITIDEIAPEYLNQGNIKLFHVENGETVEMTRVYSLEEVDAHNEYYYDILTGTITMALASFSEVAVVADTEKKWEGKFDYSWYDADAKELTIANADQLAAFGAIVGGMLKNEDGESIQDTFEKQTVKLLADVDLGYREGETYSIFYPIGYYNSTGSYKKVSGKVNDKAVTSSVSSFEGTFDGNGHTISNFYQNTWEMFGDYNDGYSGTPNHYDDAMGLFGYVVNGTVKNLTVNNFSSDGEFTPTGVIAAYAVNSTFENIAITNCNPRVYNTGNGGIVGVAGDTNAANDDHITLRNITVDNSNKISALWGSWDVACGGLVGMYRGNVDASGNATGDTISFENCHVSAQIDVYNDVCANYQYYAYRYAGMIIGSVRHNTKNTEGKTIPNMAGISATGCTVNYGDWNDYYYCEFEKNTMASYSEDYQFSRVPHSELNFTDSNGNGVVDADERASVTGCKHTHTAAENHQAIYLPFHQLFTGYSWGVSSVGLEKYSGVVTNLDIIEGDQEESVEKFKAIIENDASYMTDTTVNIGDLFNVIDDAVEKVPLNAEAIMVSVTPVGEASTANGVYTPATNWEESTLQFSGVGKAQISITDYYFCTPTTFMVEILSADKFVVKEGDFNVYAGESIVLGDLFAVVAGKTVDSEKVDVKVSATEFDYVKNTSDWTQSTLVFKDEGNVTITIKEDENYNEASKSITVSLIESAFEHAFPNTDDYLYRVGNKNAVAINRLFKISEDVKLKDLGNITVEVRKSKEDNGKLDAGDLVDNLTVSGVKWTTGGSLDFADDFTGPVVVTISSEYVAESKDLWIEVVDATNVTQWSELKEQNSVLLDNIEMPSGGTYRLTGKKTLYGNGYVFDVTRGAYQKVEYDYQSYVVYVENSCLDNVEIKGAVYPEVGGTKDADYNRAIVLTNGDVIIENCYISNGASPIRNGGNLKLINTTLKGGNYANLDLRNGHLVLDNVTTINQIGINDNYVDPSNGSKKEVVGLGVVVYQEGGTEELKITVKNSLKQYNYISSTQNEKYISGTYAKAVTGQIFSNKFAEYHYTEGTEKWVNTGIISMNNLFTKDDLVDERKEVAGYFLMSEEIPLAGQSRNCCVYSFKPLDGNIPTYPGYTTEGQGTISPIVEFDFKNKNYVANTEGSNDYCYENGGIVYISMDKGDKFSWDTSILTATKNGKVLDYTVEMNGADYTGKEISFDSEGTYEVVYAFVDANNYKLSNDEVHSFDKAYKEVILINVSVKEKAAKHAEFSFGENGSYGSRTVTIDDAVYVMPDVTGTVDKKIGSTTVNGTTVYYPITNMFTNDGKNEHGGSAKWYACFPIFKNALQIIDYADKGTGDAIKYNQDTVKTVDQIPSTLKATNPKSDFLYGMNATNYPAPTDPTVVNSTVCYTSNRGGLDGGSNDRGEQYVLAKYTYTDNAGTVYFYYIGYFCAAQDCTGCVTPDTLVTLGDGSQVRVDSLNGSEELLVWNLENGKFDSAPIMFVDSEEEAEFEIIHLYFSDGTDVKVIGEHGFWDYDLNKYVYLDCNAADYIGHEFAKQDGDKLSRVTLTDVVLETEITTAWSPVTEDHLCYFVNGMLSMPGGVGGLFNIFDVDAETMTYDFEAMAQDIETYGLFTYEELNSVEPLSEEMFNAAGGAYLKVSIGKGNMTMNDLVYMIQRYSKYFD